MKQVVSFVIVAMLTISSVFAKGNAARKHTIINNGNISITYGQPVKNGKSVFGPTKAKALAPYGHVWRAGDNEGTEITFKKDCLFIGRQLKAGTYTLFINPYHAEWLVILNSKLGQKGVFNYDKVKDKNVILAAIGAKKMDKAVDNFTITIQKDGLLVAGDQTSGFLPVKFPGE